MYNRHPSPPLRSARPETRSRVTCDCISSQSAHISTDSPVESGVASRKVSANHNDAIPDACLTPDGIIVHLSDIVARYGSCCDSVRGLVGPMDAALSRPDLLATV